MRAPTTRCAIVHRGATAAHVHSSRNAVRTRPRAKSHATSMRMPAIMPAASWVAGVRTIARRAQEGRDAICAPQNPSPLRAYALAGSLRGTRRVPPRRHRAKPQDARQPTLAAASRRAGSKRHVSGSPIKRRTEVKNTLPVGRIEGSKIPIETHTPLIRYFINDIDPKRSSRRLPVCAATNAARIIKTPSLVAMRRTL